ncbi:hypothetical protein EJB05_14955, partial [Eragrostis curvula]
MAQSASRHPFHAGVAPLFCRILCSPPRFPFPTTAPPPLRRRRRLSLSQIGGVEASTINRAFVSVCAISSGEVPRNALGLIREGGRDVLMMADEQSEAPAPAVVVAMKGHPGSGKSTAARAIAAALRCPLLDKDDVRDCTLSLEGMVTAGMLNELSYAVLWRVVERQVRLGLSVVVDSPLSRPSHLEVLTCLPATLVVIVECRAVDEKEWRRRLEERGASVAEGGFGDGWHKPKTWGELEKLLEGYQGCTDYDIGDVPRIVVDTTDPTVDASAIAVKVVGFIRNEKLIVSQASGYISVIQLRGRFPPFNGCETKMASSGLKPGVPVILRELEPSSEMFKQGASLRVTGSLQSYDMDSAIAIIQDGSVSLKVDTQHLRDVSFRTNSMYQFIGELLIRADNDAILQARIGRNVDGLDLNLYQQSLLIQRQHEAKLRSSRRA